MKSDGTIVRDIFTQDRWGAFNYDLFYSANNANEIRKVGCVKFECGASITVGNVIPENCNQKNGAINIENIDFPNATSPISFEWSNGVTGSFPPTDASLTNLTSGSYTITATDDVDCQIIQTIAVSQICSFDCPELQKNIGDPCDDNNPNTSGETIQPNCSCSGGNTSFDCPNLQKNIGDNCDDSDINTTNDQVQPNCTCQGTPNNTGGEANCNNLQFDGNNGQIKISDLTADKEKIEILGRNTNWQVVLVCDQNCDNPHIIPNLQEGTYKVKVQMFGPDRSSYCYHEEEVIVTESICPDSDQDGTCDEQDICNGQAEPGSPCDDGDANTQNDKIQADCSCKGETNGNTGGTANCDALAFSGEVGQIRVSGLTSSNQKIEIIGRETGWQIVGICDQNCSNPQVIPNLKPGEYKVKVQLYGTDNSYCYYEETVIVPEINCPDSDGDGTCDEVDICTGLPEPGTSCDDGGQ